MVTIIDPHIKRDGNYFIHKVGSLSHTHTHTLTHTHAHSLTHAQDAEEHGYYVKKSDHTSVYEGWCWPGEHHMIPSPDHMTVM